MREHDVPDGARAAARVLIFDENRRLLLFRAEGDGARWWVAPGGGIEAGESFEQAARREAEEETGFAIELGPWVWTRRHRFVFQGRQHDQYERFFVARSFEPRGQAAKLDSYIVGSRWWSHADIAASTDDFAPRRLAVLLGDILDGRYPVAPIDCGV
jgi:8-oxo-dGTP pyrophosphatase MutT (NUDIX family)